jgi:hypothetical protein
MIVTAKMLRLLNMKLGWTVRNADRILMRKSFGKRKFERLRRRLENNILTSIEEVILKGVKWTEMDQDSTEFHTLVLPVKTHTNNEIVSSCVSLRILSSRCPVPASGVVLFV